MLRGTRISLRMQASSRQGRVQRECRERVQRECRGRVKREGVHFPSDGSQSS